MNGHAVFDALAPSRREPPQIARHETTVAGGVVRIEYRIDAGTELFSHEHEHDHLSILISGEVILTAKGEAQRLIGPCAVEIKAGIRHGVFAVTDATWDCIFALQDMPDMDGL